MRTRVAAALAVFSFAVLPAHADPAADRALARDVYEQLVELDTSGELGTVQAVAALAQRLRAAGIAPGDLHDVGPSASKRNLVARIHGAGAKQPLLLLAHLDVVVALRSDWSVAPFSLLERDGYFYGRGTADDKAMAAIFTTLFIRLIEAKVVPDRDLILALTADEEGGDDPGAAWLLRERPELVDAALVLNEGGGGAQRGGVRLFNGVQASEKIYANFWLTVTDPGGHSSLPRQDNAVYRLAAALGRLEQQPFPVELNEITERFLARSAALEGGELGASLAALVRNPNDSAAAARVSERPRYNALARTTCTPTRLEGGHADNALPQTARAHLNCRILPWRTPEQVERELARIVADERVAISRGLVDVSAPPSPLDPELMAAVEEITEAMWPGVPVVPTMSTGATDSRFFRTRGVPAFGVSGLFSDVDDVRAHGRDERLLVSSFYDGLAFLDRLLRRLAGIPSA